MIYNITGDYRLPKYKLNEFNKDLLRLIGLLIQIEEMISCFMEERSQKNLDELVKHIEKIDKDWNNIKISLGYLLKIITGNNEEIVVKETEKGFEI